MNWQPLSAFGNLKDSLPVTQDRSATLQSSRISSSLNSVPTGMRRTPSSMFMPYEEDEDDRVSEGLVGKVVDSVNTVKDIVVCVVVVNLWQAVRVGIARNVCLLVVTAIEHAVGLVVCEQEISIVS
jgi:hypothetical protein